MIAKCPGCSKRPFKKFGDLDRKSPVLACCECGAKLTQESWRFILASFPGVLLFFAVYMLVRPGNVIVLGGVGVICLVINALLVLKIPYVSLKETVDET